MHHLLFCKPLVITPAGDPYYADVRHLLLMNGTNGSTTFTDEKAPTWTAFGNAQLSTANFLYGTSSYLGDGNNDYISSTHADLVIGTDDFCLEAWVRKAGNSAASSSASSIIHDYRTAEPSTQVELEILGGGLAPVTERNALGLFVNGAYRLRGQNIQDWGPTYPTAFIHMAYERIGGVGTLYADGAPEPTTYADTNNYTSNTLYIGGRFAGLPDRRSLNGNIDSSRLTVRTGGRYGGAFTPGEFLNY